MTGRRKIIIFGIGATADIVYDGIKSDVNSEMDVVAFCVDAEYYCETEKYGLPVVKFEDVEQKYDPKEYGMIIAIGYQKMNTVRIERCKQAEEKGYVLASFVHSQADVSVSVKGKIGQNVIIVKNVSIGSDVIIGHNVCIFSGAVISHHTVVEDNVWITPGTVICGRAVIGENTFLGANSVIGNDVTIGKNNFIGAGAVVTKDTEEDSVYILPDTPKYILKSSQFVRMFSL